MSRTMYVNVINEEESRIAIVSGGLLEELSIETALHEHIEGNIYKAKIVKIIPSLDAVFVEYGGNKNGFLALGDIAPTYFSGKKGADGLKRGQDLLVQVRKGELGQKGAALTTYVSIPGRYFVIMPFVDKRGVSKKIQDEATRKELRQILKDSGVPDDMGYIARTAADGRTKQDLTRDAGYLMRLWKRIQKDYEEAKAPALLYQESDIVIRTIRDYFTPAIQEVWVDDEEIFAQVDSFFQAVMPWYRKRLKRYEEKAPIFAKHNLEDQIASIYEKTVPLKSGGSIVIEQTEALVSVDVNSGKTNKGKDIEATAFIANKEAAEEVARQLRLRDMGGLIVLDFIDMRSSEHRAEVKKVLQKALKDDKARTDVGAISKFGMLELSRQRLKSGASLALTRPCPTCFGAGKVRSVEGSVLAILRMIQAGLARGGRVTQVCAGLPAEVATLLLNRKRRVLFDLEADFGVTVTVFPEAALHANQYYVEYRDEGGKKTETNLPESFPRSLLKTPGGLPAVASRPTRPPSYALFDEEEPEVPVEPPDEGEAPAAAVEGASAPEEIPEEPGTKRKRKRRRKKRKGGAGQTSEGVAGSEEESTEGEAEDAAERDAEDASVTAREDELAEPEASSSAPASEGTARLSASAKRRARRRRKKTTGEGPAPVAPAAPEAAVATEEAPPDTPGPVAERRGRRRPRKAPTTPTTPTVEVEVQPAPPAEPPAEAAAATEQPLPSPRRRRSPKPKAEAPAAPAQPFETPSAPAPETATATTTPARKPRRPRTPRAKAAEE